jgi:hypothetical protein
LGIFLDILGILHLFHLDPPANISNPNRHFPPDILSNETLSTVRRIETAGFTANTSTAKGRWVPKPSSYPPPIEPLHIHIFMSTTPCHGSGFP